MLENFLMKLVCIFVCWEFANAYHSSFEDQTQLNKMNSYPVMNHIMRFAPDMRMMLNGLLRYENFVKRPQHDYPFLHEVTRSKGTALPLEDPLRVMATGFLGSRGKKQDTDEIPVFANGFPAGRG